MTQTRATSAEMIYQTLTDDVEFMSYVGKYKFIASTGELDAISVITPGESLPEIEYQKGLEVVIHDTGLAKRMDYLTSVSDILVTYQVYLILWPDADGQLLTDATSRILRIFSNSKAVSTVPTANNITSLVQSLILIPENSAIMV